MPTPTPEITKRIILARWEINGHITWVADMAIKENEVVVVRSQSAFDCLIQLGRFEPTIIENEFLFGGEN